MRIDILSRLYRQYRRRIFSLLAIAIVCFSLVSCATTANSRKAAQEREIQWPPLPLQARIVWVNEISNYLDAGIEKGFWRKMADFFAGEAESRIGKPYGVYCDDRERLFIVDVGYAMVHVMDLKEKRYSTIGQGKENILRSPIAIVGDDQQNLYITDSGAGTIYRYNLKKNTLEAFIVADLGRPTGIAFNKNNRLLYITDTTAHQVAVFDLRGNERFRIGSHGDGPGQFNYPTDLFIDSQGRLYVTDALNSRVSIFSAEGGHLKTFGRPGDTGGHFAKPKGIAVDSDGNIYICDALLDAVQMFNDAGELLLTFGSNGVDPGQFWMPAGIHIDRNDTIYVADSYNRRVQVFQYLKMERLPRADSGSSNRSSSGDSTKQ